MELRDFYGSKCPCCARDILQQAPSHNRMPGEALAWCPTCDARLSLDDLRNRAGVGGFFKRFFGRPQSG